VFIVTQEDYRIRGEGKENGKRYYEEEDEEEEFKMFLIL